MESLITDLNDPKIWQDPKSAQKLNKEKVHLEREVSLFTELEKSIQTLLEIKRAKANNRHNNKNKLRDPREEQSALGDNDGEVREPNTIGLP